MWNRPSPDVPEGRLPPAKPVSLQGPGEGEEECGGERDWPAGERPAQDRERGTWRTGAGSPQSSDGGGKHTPFCVLKCWVLWSFAVLCRYFEIFLTTVCLNSLDDSARLSRPSQPAPEQHLWNQLQTGKVIALELVLIYSSIIIYTLIYCFSYITVFLLCISKIQAANWRQLSF